MVKYPDDTYKSSPFRIRFGTFKVLRAKDKNVVIGTLLGTQIDKIIDISNSFPINHSFVEKGKAAEETNKSSGG